MENKSKKLKRLKERLSYIKKLYNIDEDDVLECDDAGQILLYNIPLDEWHKRMWEWIATYETNGATKEMFIDANFKDESMIKPMLWICGDCFACIYNHIVNDEYVENCELCPICKHEYQNGCLDGLYYEYVTTPRTEQTKRYNLAKEIAELNWEWKGIKNENREPKTNIENENQNQESNLKMENEIQNQKQD